jgi:hypothetical protein
MYDNDCVAVLDDKGREYRMPCSTIIKMANEFKFKTKKKRKYVWIEEVADGKDVLL